MKRVQDLAWPGQLLVAASALAAAALLVVAVVGAAAQVFLMPEASVAEPVVGEAVEVAEPSPVISVED